MRKSTKWALVLLVLIAVFAVFRMPQAEDRTGVVDGDALTRFQEAREQQIPVFLEFYGRY